MGNKKGFSLIELIAVIIIIGIIAIIAIPVVSNYVNSSRDKTYVTYENSMTQAAKNKVLTCENDASLKCELPDTINAKTKIKLYELIEQGFIDNMKNPGSEEFCDADNSYVEVTKAGLSDYEYEACLYCGEYKTEGVCKTVSLDDDDPECGEVTGESTRWTKENRTIAVKCSDKTSGCEKTSFSKTFTTTTKEGSITIQDKSGRTKQCPVKVYVDKTLPTCELEVEEGDYISNVGWYSLNAKVKLKSTGDNESGLLTYGIGTSLENRNYDKKEEITVGSGITTVIGYVKDFSGNEGVCGLDVRVGTSVPTFKFYYGYPVYPNKENYVLSQITESPAQTLKTTGTNPTITIDGLAHYGEIEKVRVTLTGNPSSATKASILSNGTVIGQGAVKTNSNIVEITIPKGNYENLKLRLGELNNKTYNVSKIEVLTTRGDIITNQSVTVYLEQLDNGMKTTEATFNNGGNWQSELYKTFSSNATNTVKTRNKILMESEPQVFNITHIDKVIPMVKLTAKKKTSGTIVLSNVWSNEELEFVLESVQSGESGAIIYYCKDTNNTCEPTIVAQNNNVISDYNTLTGEYYIRYKIVSGSGNESMTESYHAKVDTNKPTVSIAATKKTGGAAVSSGTWSSDYLNYKFVHSGVGLSGATIYYCKDTNNTCNPATTVGNASSIIDYNTLTGEYYLRYKVVSGAGNSSLVESYHAKVDALLPTCEIIVSDNGTVATLTIVGNSLSGISSNGYSWTSASSGFTSTNTKVITENGTYNAWVKNNAGNVGTCSKKVESIDKVVPTVSIAATKKTGGAAVSSGTWSSDYLNFKLTQGTVGSSGATIYYCKDTNNTCNPTTPIGSGTSITGYNTTAGTYYIRYKIVSGAGLSSSVGSYTAKVDVTTPTVSIAATKKTGEAAVSSGTWSNDYLNFKLTQETVGSSGATIYHCKDTANTCNPTTATTSGNLITAYNTTAGTYYIRYKILSGAGLSSSVGSYTAKVDVTTPTVSIAATKNTGGAAVSSGTWSSDYLNFKLTQATVGSSGATIYYCGDTANTCNPTTPVASGTSITGYNTTAGTYYIRYKIVSGAGLSSSVGSYTARVDVAAPSVPTFMVTSFRLSVGGYSYLITASGSDSNSNSSGTKGYQFSLNNGSSWSNVQTSSKFTVSSTTAANFTHNVKVRVVDNAGNSATSSSAINITPARALIYQLYEQVLGREPAINEVDNHNANTNAASIALNIAASKEANQRLSNNYTNYAKALYNGILGRAASSSETSAVANWALLLKNNGVMYTVKHFTASSEFQQICSKYSMGYKAL